MCIWVRLLLPRRRLERDFPTDADCLSARAVRNMTLTATAAADTVHAHAIAAAKQFDVFVAVMRLPCSFAGLCCYSYCGICVFFCVTGVVLVWFRVS